MVAAGVPRSGAGSGGSLRVGGGEGHQGLPLREFAFASFESLLEKHRFQDAPSGMRRDRFFVLGDAAEDVAQDGTHSVRERIRVVSVGSSLERPAGRNSELLHLVVESPRRHAVLPRRLQSTHSGSDSFNCTEYVVSRVLLVSFPFRFLLRHIGRYSR